MIDVTRDVSSRWRKITEDSWTGLVGRRAITFWQSSDEVKYLLHGEKGEGVAISEECDQSVRDYLGARL